MLYQRRRCIFDSVLCESRTWYMILSYVLNDISNFYFSKVCLFVVGMPCMYLELALGQYFQCGNITIWGKLNPYMKGLGYSVIIINIYMVIYCVSNFVCIFCTFIFLILRLKNQIWCRLTKLIPNNKFRNEFKISLSDRKASKNCDSDNSFFNPSIWWFFPRPFCVQSSTVTFFQNRAKRWKPAQFYGLHFFNDEKNNLTLPILRLIKFFLTDFFCMWNTRR